jgi:hypothetical protein
MINRCENPKNNSFQRYGEKNITVCESWKSYENFILDMGERPKNTTLDRINPYEGYYKENCRWASAEKQQNNRTNNFKIFAFGKSQTLTQWARERDIPWATLRKRIVELNWTPEKALTTKVRKCLSRKVNQKKS